MKPNDLETVRTLVFSLWPKALPAQWRVLSEKIADYELKPVCVIVREVFATPHKGFQDATAKIVERCRATKVKYIGEPASAVRCDPETREGRSAGEWCDMVYEGVVPEPVARATPRGLAWMRSIGEKRARAEREGRTPFEPTVMDLVLAATSFGASPIGRAGKGNVESKKR